MNVETIIKRAATAAAVGLTLSLMSLAAVKIVKSCKEDADNGNK